MTEGDHRAWFFKVSIVTCFHTIYKIISKRMWRLILDCTHVIIILTEESKGPDMRKVFMEDLMIGPMVVKEAAREQRRACCLIMKVLLIS